MRLCTQPLPWLRALLVLVACAAGAAHAARPMVTDDARIVDAGACQVESWTRFNRGSTEFWAQPSCNFTGNLEVMLGGARTHDDAQGGYLSDVTMQAKTLFKTLEPGGWSWGLAVGNARHRSAGAARGPAPGDLYAYVPTSFSLMDDRAVLHTNLGWLHDKELRRHRMTWGVGTEVQLTASTWLIAETFGQNSGKPLYQMGVRYWVVPDRVQIDATYGNRMGSSTQERWFSVGLRLLSPAFMGR